MTAALPADWYKHPDKDLAKGHRLMQERWPLLDAALQGSRFNLGRIQVIEVYRPDMRQQWLYGQGRTAEQCVAKGVPVEFARPGLIVTNAWSAAVGAHGWTEPIPGSILRAPASCAIDVVPVGPDGRAWTKDDRFDEFVQDMIVAGPEFGLVHFHSAGKTVTDRPHLQLIEWSDKEHRLVLPDFGRPGAGSL